MAANSLQLLQGEARSRAPEDLSQQLRGVYRMGGPFGENHAKCAEMPGNILVGVTSLGVFVTDSAVSYTLCQSTETAPEQIMLKMLPLVLLLVSSGDQQSSKPAAPSTLTQPSPEMQRLVKSFVGTWSITLRVEPNEKLPRGGKGEGEEVWKPGPGGLSLIEDYHSTGDDGQISGLGVAWWDESAQKYQVTWCDSGNPAGCGIIKNGAKWEGSQVVALDEWETDGKKVMFKEVFSDITPMSFKQTLYQGESGGELKKIETIVATRTASRSK